VKQKKPLPKGAIIGLVVVAALLVAFVGYSILVKPQKTRLKSVQAEILATQQTIDLYKQQAQQSQPTAAPKVRVADIYRLARAMPSVEGMADILVELDSVSRSAGVVLTNVSPSAAQPGAGFQIVQLQITFEGDFFATTDFLYRLRTLVDVRHGQLEAGGRIFAVEQGTLSPSAGNALLQGQVTLETYVYGSGDSSTGSTAAPAPATPTDTSATTTAPTSTTSASAEGAP
jgi:Tfp pilus assembly protein PilO